MPNDLPKRKLLRLQNFDYSTAGAYFITICAKDRKMLFSPSQSPTITPNIIPQMIERTFLETITQYNGVDSPIYVVMPNHFHAIITISHGETSPSLSQIVQSFKRYSTIEYAKMVKNGTLPPFDKQIWQRSFYDHIIRNREDYNEIYKYIYENPIRWQQDKFYGE